MVQIRAGGITVAIQLVEPPAERGGPACTGRASFREAVGSCLPCGVGLSVAGAAMLRPGESGEGQGDGSLRAGLLGFALGFAYVVEETARFGAAEFDPDEYSTFVLLRLLADGIEFRSLRTGLVGAVTLAEARRAVRALNEVVRARLLQVDPGFASNAELGAWVRGEVEWIAEPFPTQPELRQAAMTAAVPPGTDPPLYFVAHLQIAPPLDANPVGLPAAPFRGVCTLPSPVSPSVREEPLTVMPWADLGTRLTVLLVPDAPPAWVWVSSRTTLQVFIPNGPNWTAAILERRAGSVLAVDKRTS